MYKKEVFQGAHPKVNDYFIRCVGIMSTCDNIQDFTELIESVLIVAGSQYSGINVMGEDVICEEKYKFLISRIKTFIFFNENAEDYDDDEREYD